MKTIFIDGQAGTTGLRIRERLSARDDIQLITLPEEKRKDPQARREALNDCDAAFLCLPDDAAIEAERMVTNPKVVVLDTSTAHRTQKRFAYGFPELSRELRAKVERSKRIAVPGCHASGFVALMYPLIQRGVLSPDDGFTCFSLTGYSGGGKKMIAEYEAEDRDVLLDAPRQYALGQTHKHLKEMVAISGLNREPIFCPIVADYYSGMEVTVPLFRKQLQRGSIDVIKAIYQDMYKGPIVTYVDDLQEGGFLSAGGMSGLDGMQISVSGNDERMLLIARFDNLGKGASGAAVQCLNLAMGCEETKSLELNL